MAQKLSREETGNDLALSYCDAPTKRPIAATFDHLRPLNSPSVWRGFVRGTYKTFGLRATVTPRKSATKHDHPLEIPERSTDYSTTRMSTKRNPSDPHRRTAANALKTEERVSQYYGKLDLLRTWEMQPEMFRLPTNDDLIGLRKRVRQIRNYLTHRATSDVQI